MLLQFVQIAFWLALSTWFGGVLFIALSAPVVFSTVREYNPILPTVLSVNLEGQHGMLLAGTIVGNLLARLLRIQIVCAATLLLAIIVHWARVPLTEGQKLVAVLRAAMFLAAVIVVVYDWRVVWPRINKYREQYLAHADEPEVANVAKDEFDRYHRESVLLLTIVLALLLGIVLFSANLPVGGGSTFTFSQ